VSEWWGQSDIRLSMLLEKEKQGDKFLPSSPVRTDRRETTISQVSQEKKRDAPSVKKFFFESRRSTSRPLTRSWLKPDKTTYTLRPDTRMSFSGQRRTRKESFDMYEDKIYNEAVSQSSRIAGL